MGKKKVKDEELENLKHQMIEIIKKMPMPMLYSRQEADSDYTLGVISPSNVVTSGYACDFLNKHKVSLEELDICDLSGIIVYGEKMSKQAIDKIKAEDMGNDEG